MVSVLRSAIAVSVASVMTVFATSVDVRASGPLPAELRTRILNVIGKPDHRTDRCLAVAKLSELVAANPNLTTDIVDFSSLNLIRRPNNTGRTCDCPAELAVATVRAAPEHARTTRRILEGRYPQCASAVETAMRDTLVALAPDAGSGTQSRPPKYPGMRSTEETCRDASTPGCGSSMPNGTAAANASQGRSGQGASLPAGVASSEQAVPNPAKATTGAALPPAVLQQVTELIEQGGVPGKQCFAGSKMMELLAAHPTLAVQIIDYAGGQLSSRSSSLDDRCLCPIELATAVVSTVPEQANRARFVLEDKYPECTPEVDVAMEETLATLAPGAGIGSTSRPPNYPGMRPTEEMCRDTSAPGCGFVKPNDRTSASPDQRSSADSPQGSQGQANDQTTPIALIPPTPGQSPAESGSTPHSGQQPSSNAGLGGPGQPGTNPSQPPASGPLPPDVARQVTEVIEQNGGSGKQCFPVQQMVEIMAAYPHLAVQVIDFAGEQLSSSSSLLNDNCLCAIDFATAAVSAVPEQANRARFVLEDKYPECTPRGGSRHGGNIGGACPRSRE